MGGVPPLGYGVQDHKLVMIGSEADAVRLIFRRYAELGSVTIAEEDAKRPNRERECLVGERTRIVNRMKGTLARLGIRNFKPTLRKAAERLATLHTPEGSALPPNVSAESQRNMARLGVVVSQIKEIEGALAANA